MYKIKYLYFAFTFCMLMLKSYGQVTISANGMAVYNPNIEFVSDCGEIKFKNASSIQILFNVTLSKPFNFDGTGEIKVYLKKNINSNLVLLNSVTSPNASFPTASAGNVSYTTGVAGGIVINATDVDYTGSKLVIRYQTQFGYYSTSCDYTFTKNLPSFTLSSTPINSFSCGDSNPRTFTVTPANIPSGSILTYQWNIGSGWSGTATTSMNTITLTPLSGFTLPSAVSVTPKINGVSQSVLSSAPGRISFSSSATLSGNSIICTGNSSIYTINGLGAGNTVTWSSSKPLVASISGATQSQVSLNGLMNGVTNLTATITNQCGQVTTKSFNNITIGTPFLPNGVVAGSLWLRYNFSAPVSFPPVISATSYNWTIGPGEDGFPCTVASNTLPKFANGLLTITTTTSNTLVYSRTCLGDFKIYCEISNSCGSVVAYDRDFTVGASGSSPCKIPTILTKMFTLYQNPIKNGKLNIINNNIEIIDSFEDNGDTTSNIVVDDGPCFIEYPQVYIPLPGTGKQITSTIEIQIYDMNGNKVYQNNVDKNQNNFELDIQNLKPSSYILYISQNGVGEKQIIIVE